MHRRGDLACVSTINGDHERTAIIISPRGEERFCSSSCFFLEAAVKSFFSRDPLNLSRASLEQRGSAPLRAAAWNPLSWLSFSSFKTRQITFNTRNELSDSFRRYPRPAPLVVRTSLVFVNATARARRHCQFAAIHTRVPVTHRKVGTMCNELVMVKF